LTDSRTLGGFSLSGEVAEDRRPGPAAQAAAVATAETARASRPGARTRAERRHRKTTVPGGPDGAVHQGKLFGLRWSDVDLEQAVVRVRRSYTGRTVSTPKNRERRDVDLISDVVELLIGWRRGSGSATYRDSLVFPGENDLAFFTPSVLLRRQLYPAMARASMPRVGPTQEKRTFHSFRHTFAKRALERGAQVTWLSRHLGHSSLKVTTDIYRHWERAELKLQAAKMEGAFPV
jgi:integrase